MWLLRQNVQYNKRSFFKDILAFVFISHIMVLAMIFLCQSGTFHQEHFIVTPDNTQSTVVFIPLKKRIVQHNTTVTHNVQKSGKRTVINYDAYEKKVAAQEKKQQKIKTTVKKTPIQIKPATKQPVKKTPEIKVSAAQAKKQAATSLQAEKKKQALEKQEALKKAKIAAEKLAQLAVEKKLAEKRATEKLVADTIAAAQAAKLAEKTAIKIEPKITLPVEQHIPVLEQQPELVPLKPHETDLHDSDGQTDIDLENITFVGSHDLEMIHIKEQIQAQVVKYYKPPVGIAKQAVCQLAVLVGVGGKAQRVTVKKASGSMANDMCARAALLKVTFPKEVIGKEIIVELGQS